MRVMLCACNQNQATSSMYSRPLVRSALLQVIFAGAILLTDRPCPGSIVLPDSVGVNANEFDCLFSSDASSSPAPNNSNNSERADNLEKTDAWDFLKAIGSGGSTTSNSSTSSTGGASGVSCVLCVLA